MSYPIGMDVVQRLLSDDNVLDDAKIDAHVAAADPHPQYQREREVLTANRTYYVRTDGNDNNTGLTNDAAGAWLTLAKAMTFVATELDFNNTIVTIQLGSGSYVGPRVLAIFTGPGNLVIQGNSGDRTAVTLTNNSATSVVYQANCGNVAVILRHLTIDMTSAVQGINITGFSAAQHTFENLRFIGSASNRSLWSISSSTCSFFNTFEFDLSTSIARVFSLSVSAALSFGSSSFLFTTALTATSAFLQAGTGVFLISKTGGTITGTFTGTKFSSTSPLNLGSTSLTLFPGSPDGTFGAGQTSADPTLAQQGATKNYVDNHQLLSATVAELANLTPTAGRQRFCTNESGGAVPVFGDGTNWRRVTDRAIVS